MNLKLINEPILYQGRKRYDNYFEGWYFKNVSDDLKSVVSIIPGISVDKHDSHAFIQVIVNKNNDYENKIETYYHKFPSEEFKYSDNPFILSIGKNKFSHNGIKLKLHDENCHIHGEINFSEFTKIRTSMLFPNAMGYFAYLPFMECYHEIISMSHRLYGSLAVNGEEISFNFGSGYAEKDWGTSFPKEYIWIQSNNFKDSEASLMCSVANIPFPIASFRGFICNLTFNGREYRFASYNNSKIKRIDYTEDSVNISINKNKLTLDIEARMLHGGILRAPKNGAMNKSIKEGLNGMVTVRLTKNTGEALFSGTGNCCGIELVKSLQ